MPTKIRDDGAKIFVALPVFNRKETTLACLRQLGEQSRPPDLVVVSDGGSSDGTPAAIREAFPDAAVLESREDLFWGHSIARAIDHVLALEPADDDVIIVMNDDVKMPPDLVEVLARVCRKERAAVGAIVIDENASERVLDGGVTIDWRNYRFVNSKSWPAGRRLRDDVDVLNGRSTAVLVEMVRRVGNVDGKSFPHYLADYDFTQRIKKAGYRLAVTGETKVYVSPKASGLHLRRSQTGLSSAMRLAFSRRSRVNLRDHARFAFRHAPKKLIATRVTGTVAGKIVMVCILNPYLRRVREGVIYQRLRTRALRRMQHHFAERVEAVEALGLEKIGSRYGGWVVPTRLMASDWICYCGGVGEDITFDLGLIERFGCEVFAFDPTPRSIAHVEREAAGVPRYRFKPVGLWSDDQTLRFYEPKNPNHVSHSVVNLQQTGTYFEAPCRSIASLMAELGHDRIDLLKIDIEGAEHTVIAAMLDTGIRPKVLCTEIDQPVSFTRYWRTINRILASGYRLIAADGWNYSFLREDAFPAPAPTVR